VVRVRQIAEDQAAGKVAMAEGEALAATRRAEEAHERTRVHPLASQGGMLSGNALAASAGSAAALMSAAHTASDVATRAAHALQQARVHAASARGARMMAERLADRRDASMHLHEQRTQQRTLDESVAAQHGRTAS
jgi:hypothetical protein